MLLESKRLLSDSNMEVMMKQMDICPQLEKLLQG